MITLIPISILLGLITSLIIASIIIPLLKRKKINQRLSIYLSNQHEIKKNTPTMGGIIFVLPPLLIIILGLILNKISFSYNLLIIIIVFVGYALIGFIDDLLIIIRNNNDGLSENNKFFLQIILAVLFFYLFLKSGNEPLLWIHFLNLKINIGFFYGMLILLVLVGSSNAVNITDGLDGLAGSLSLIALATFGVIVLNTGWLEGYLEIAIFIFCLVGALIGFLFFNISPAKIFMGDTGSLSLGALLGAIAILTRHELLLILIGIVFVLETLSCIIQRIYYKFRKKRIFPMTPIHHTFEKKMKETEVVKIFVLFGLIFSMLALVYGVIL